MMNDEFHAETLRPFPFIIHHSSFIISLAVSCPGHGQPINWAF
jgi:hypothetical protein